MTSITEGGITFLVTDEATVKVTHKSGGNMNVNPPAQNIADDMQNDLKDNMSRALDSVEDELVYALANANRLCLPAAGAFLMKDPTFNQNGDLMVTLTYNGYFACFTLLLLAISNTGNRADPPPPPPKGKYKLRKV